MTWVQTRRGNLVDLANTDPADIVIEDIAWSLARLPRFAGHTRRRYVVAEHCIHVAALLPIRMKIYGLLHDAAEAYIGDIPKPFKDMFPCIAEAEDRILDAVYAAARIPPPDAATKARVARADADMLRAEQYALMPANPVHIDLPSGPVCVAALGTFSDPDVAFGAFMHAFETFKGDLR